MKRGLVRAEPSPAQIVAEVAGWCGLFAVIHSALAANPTKALVARWCGERQRNGLYRAAYVGSSALLTGGIAQRIMRLPDRVLYEVPAPWAWGLRLGQLASLGLIGAVMRHLGVGRSSGASELLHWLGGQTPVPEPVAQGPAPDHSGKMSHWGPFGWSRHPGNLAAIGVFGLWPRMTRNRAVVAVLASVYAVIGSVHEEQRLTAAYGKAYARYRREVPFLLPGKRRSLGH